MIITHKFDMAVDRRGPAPLVDAVQGEKNVRTVAISLYTTPSPNEKEPWPVPDGVSAMVRFRKHDGTGGVYDTLPDGTTAITIADNTVSVVLAPQVLTAPGPAKAQVELTSGEQTMATFAFNIRVEADPSVGAMDSEDYINLSGYVTKEVERILAEGNITAGEANSVKQYGAAGDGVTDDTAAFRAALAAERVVTVPGGTYVLSGTLVIRENCCLELSQDTVLKFTQTEGSCIEMRGSAVYRGNHGVVIAPYGFTGHVFDMDTLKDGTNHASIPPYAKACPQWKRQRFVYDVNIIMPNSYGFNRAESDGVCSGTAIYMSATNVPQGTDNPDNADITFLWGVTMSGIRIAGGFSYGIHAINYDCVEGSDDAWNHDMRIEAVIEGCEIGVALENCNGAHLNVTVQPNTSNPGGTKYAKQGVLLRDSRFVDMLRSRVWDWHVARSDSEEYKHIALYGNCRGLLLDDFLVHESSADIRDQIYTDTESNFDTMTILQDPGNKSFKSVDGVPYYNNGTSNKKLMLASDKFTAEQMDFIHPADGYYTQTPNFTNLVSGYEDGMYLAASGEVAALSGYVTTDFTPIDGAAAHTYRIGGKDILWNDSYAYCRIAWYDADKALKGSVMQHTKIGSNEYYPAWVEDDTVAAAFSTNELVSPPIGAAYFRITAKGSGANLIVTVDEKQDYTSEWHGEPKRMDESIYAQNLILKSPSGKVFQLTIDDSGVITPTEFAE